MLLTPFASAAEGAGADKTDAFAASMKSFVNVIKTKSSGSNKKIDLSDSTDLALIQTQVTSEVAKVSGVNTTAFNSLSSSTATAIKNVNDKIKTVTDITSDSSKNIFATTQVLKDQIKDAVTSEVTSAGSGAASMTFTNKSAIDTASTNKAPTNIALSAKAISEAASSLVIGRLSTTDSDQPTGKAFKYKLAKINDHSAFTIDKRTGDLSFKLQPDYETKSDYKVTVISRDDGGKSFSKTFDIKVTDARDSLDAALIKGTINYVNRDIFTDLDTLAKALETDSKSTGDKLEAELKKADWYLNKWGSSDFNANNSSFSVTSKGFKITDAKNYTIEALFNNFQPNSLAQIQQLANIDPDKSETWIIDGGFSSIKIAGPNGDIATVSIASDATTITFGSNFYDATGISAVKLHGKILDNNITKLLTLFEKANDANNSYRYGVDNTTFNKLRDFVKGEFELTGISLFRGNDTKPAVYTGYSGDTYSVTLEDYTFSVTAQDIATTLNIPGEEIVNFRTFTREERTKFNDNAYDRAGKSGTVKFSHSEHGDLITVTTDDLSYDTYKIKGQHEPGPDSWKKIYGITSTGEHYVHDSDHIRQRESEFW